MLCYVAPFSSGGGSHRRAVIVADTVHPVQQQSVTLVFPVCRNTQLRIPAPYGNDN